MRSLVLNQRVVLFCYTRPLAVILENTRITFYEKEPNNCQFCH